MFKKIAANWFDLFSHCRNCICGPEIWTFRKSRFQVVTYMNHRLVFWRVWMRQILCKMSTVWSSHQKNQLFFSDDKLHWSFMGIDTVTRFTMDWVSRTCWQYRSVLDDKPWWVSKHLGAARKSIDLSGQVAVERKWKQKRKRRFAKANFRTNLFQAREFDADSNGIINEDDMLDKTLKYLDKFD